jgi:outer membrane protein
VNHLIVTIIAGTVAALAAMAQPARGADLLDVFEQAKQSDPQYKSAQAAHEAALEVVPQSRAVLFPDIRSQGSIERVQQNPRSDDPTFYSTNRIYSLILTQPLYQRELFVQLKQADGRAAQADAQLAAAYQDLMLRVATAYFQVLGALDNLEFVQADKAAIARTLEQAKQRFEVGLSAITDVQEAQARYDLAVSAEIEANTLLADAREGLRELTGVLYEELDVLRYEIPLLSPDPDSPSKWVDTALEQNLQVLAAQAGTEVARQEIEVQRSGHYPSLKFNAAYDYLDNNFGGVVPLERNDASIGLQFDIPLYQGGLVNSQTRQARDRFQQAQEDYEQVRRSTERQARNSYQGVISGIAQVKALHQAVISNETATKAAQAGFDVGTRTIVDVLDQQRDLLAAMRDYARSRYDYLLEGLSLKQAAGTLAVDDLQGINNMLVK